MTCHSADLCTQSVGPGLPPPQRPAQAQASHWSGQVHCLNGNLWPKREEHEIKGNQKIKCLATLSLDGLVRAAVILYNLSEDFYWQQSVSIACYKALASLSSLLLLLFFRLYSPISISRWDFVSQALFSRGRGLRKSCVSYLLYFPSSRLKALHVGWYLQLDFLSFFGMFSFDNHS